MSPANDVTNSVSASARGIFIAEMKKTTPATVAANNINSLLVIISLRLFLYFLLRSASLFLYIFNLLAFFKIHFTP